MSSQNENQMEVEENNSDEECILDEPNDKATENGHKSMPSTPIVDKKSNLNPQNTSFKSAEKTDKNLKLQMKLENAKKRQEEKKGKRKKEREEQRLKREEELKKKREEEERIKLKKQEEREKEKERKAAELAEKERIRQELLNQRNEEKKKRDEEKRLKEEEKKKLEEEKKKLEEEKLKEEEEKRRKEEKIKNNFISFFIKKETPVNENDKEELKNYRFMPFQPKENMKVAPICRRTDIINMSSEERENFYLNIQQAIFDQDKKTDIPTYLKEIRKNPKLIRKQTRGCRRNQVRTDDESSNSCDVKEIIVNIANETKFKVKYLHFDPKVFKRPPYYGTWRKKSKSVGPRRPFAKEEIFDYEVDSDDEWEDEPDGESIADSGKGDEDDEIIDEDDDDGFLVPHGHLSDDELDEDERQLDAETKKAREAAKNEQYERESKKSKKILVPKCFIVSNYWSSETTFGTDCKIVNELKLLEKFKMVSLVNSFPITIHNETTIQQKEAKNNEETSSKPSKSKNPNTAGNEASPSTVKTIKTNKSKIQLIQSPMSLNSNSNGNTATNSASPSNSTPSIIKFISKMSKKDVICKLEPVNVGGNGASTTTASISTPLSPLPSKVAANFATPGTPNTCSPKMTPTNTTAEKRVCSGNGENAVKRLKLDDSQATNTNEQKLTTTPNSIINMFKNSSSCKKSLKMSKVENSSSQDVECDKASPVKMDVSSNNPSNELNNKENKINVITID